MSNCKPKQLKFAGEDSFIVQKPGTKKYLMAVAQEKDTLLTQNAINAEVVPMDNISITNPTEVASDVQVVAPPPVMIQSPDWSVLTCDQILKEIESIQNMLMVSKFSDPNIYSAYQDIIQKGKIIYSEKCEKISIIPPDEVPPAPPVYSEPNWSSLTCEQIKQEISNIQSMLSAGMSLLDEQRQILVMSYKNGTKALERCNVSETPLEPSPLPPAPPNIPTETTTTTSTSGGVIGAPPITTITTTGTPIIATATAGGLTSSSMPKSLGGGGGGGATKEEKPTLKKEGTFNWWWLVAAAAGIYLLASKNKS
jgi:hypothetical protein